MRLPTTILVALLVLGVSSVGSAQTPDELNQAGIEAFAAGEFERAAQNFKAAHDKDPDPIFRKSEAVAWFKAGNCEDAIEAANAFLLQWNDGEAEANEASSVVANCKIELATTAADSDSFDLAERLLFEAEQHARDSYTRDRISSARVELARQRKAALEEERAARQEKEVVIAEPPAPEPRSRVPGYATIAAGSALLVAGGVLHTVALARTAPRLRDAEYGDRAEYDQLARRLDTSRILVPVLYAVGAATLGTGIWLTVNKSGEEPSRSGEVSGGVSFSGRF